MLADLEAFLGHAVDVAQGEQTLAMVTAFAKAYTRGRGFVDGVPAEPIAAVIITATARLLNNPTGRSFAQIEDFSHRPGTFHGWNLVERLVLNGYRLRAT